MPELIWKWKRERKASHLLPGEYAASLRSLKSEKGEELGTAVDEALDSFFSYVRDRTPSDWPPRHSPSEDQPKSTHCS